MNTTSTLKHHRLLASIFVLMLLVAAPAWAQKGTLSLSTDESIKAGDPISDADLPTWLANKTSIHYSGDTALDVALLVMVVQDGKITSTHRSDAFSVSNKSTGKTGGEALPKADWFPSNKASKGGNKAGFFDWLWGLVGWGPDATPTAPSGAWAGWTAAQCNELKDYSARNACLAAVGGGAPLHQTIPTTGTVVVVMPQLAGNPGDDFKTEGMVFTLANSN